MPRPKVPDNERQRAAEACSFCRELKKRCSGVAPCSQCLGRGIGEQCVITCLPRGHRSKPGRPTSRRNPRRLRRVSPAVSHDTGVDGDAAMISPYSEPTNLSLSEERAPSSNACRIQSPPESRREGTGLDSSPPRYPTTIVRETTDPSLTVDGPRMLCTDRGEPVFIGGSASISFLETVRHVVTSQIGPSPFSHNEGSGIMLETESPQARAKAVVSSEMTENINQLSLDRKLEYLQCYYDVTEALIDAFEPLELEELLETQEVPISRPRPEIQVSPMVRGCLDMVLAIGAQCSRAPGDAEFGRACLRRAQIQVFSGFIEDPDIDVVRLFLLMAFYMLGESRRNTAYMYLSIATRGALALGLHISESYEGKQSTDLKARLRQVYPTPSSLFYTRSSLIGRHVLMGYRLRLWLSARIMDQLVNAILGRPAVTLAIRTKLDQVIDRLLPMKHNPRIASLTICSEIVSYINKIDEGLYNGNDASPLLIEKYLQDIDNWKLKLPQAFAETSMGITGKLHISCLYYFAVSQAARPAFLLSLSGKSDKASKHSPMAAACYEAAMYLSQTCSDAWKAGLLRGNMCILKALIFAAGLVLGVENFAQEQVCLEVEEAFQRSKDVLAFFSSQSPQAAHYLEILTSLSTAIATRRSREKLEKSSHFVTKLFTLSSLSSTERDSTTELAWEPLALGDIGPPEGTSNDKSSGGSGMWPQSQSDFPDFDIDWQSLNISQWDSFPFLSETMS